MPGTKRSFPGGSEDDRRVQSRHFHTEPNPSPVSRLYRHALESIFAFLNQGEVVAALQVSHKWLDAVQSMGILKLEVTASSAPLWVIAASTLGRHITTLGTEANSVKLSSESFFILARHLKHLTKLACELYLPLGRGMLSVHTSVRELNIKFMTSADIIDISAALKSVSQMSQLLSLTLHLPTLRSQHSFASLAELSSLCNLNIHINCPVVKYSHAQVDELRALSWLTRFNVSGMTTSLLLRLLRQPHQLQWQDISLPKILKDESLTLLSRLSSLTEIDTVVSCGRFNWLQSLSNLMIIDIQFFGPFVDGRTESLVTGLQWCTAVKVLALRHVTGLTDIHFMELLQRLPRLHSLNLFNLDIQSLSFLTQQPMTHQLTILQLSECTQLPLTELLKVHSLSRLEKLDLDQSFNVLMDANEQAIYTPPSLVLPQLMLFRYAAPQL